MVNVAVVAGNITRDAEVRVTKGGTPVMTFTVAVNEKRRDQYGEYTDYAHFIPCVLFGTRANSLQRWMTKGTNVTVQGKLNYSSWEKDGQKRNKIELVVSELDFKTVYKSDRMDADVYDDDIPFD